MSEAGEPASDALAAEPGIGRRFRRFFLLLLYFVAAAPPIGSVIFFTLVAVGKIETAADAAYALAAPFIGLLFSPFSYLFGALPAAIGGAGVAAWQAFRGPVSAVAIAILGALLGLGVAAVTQGIFGVDFKAVDWPAAISMFLTAMLPTLICWYPVRKRYYPALASPADTGRPLA